MQAIKRRTAELSVRIAGIQRRVREDETEDTPALFLTLQLTKLQLTIYRILKGA